MGLPALVVGTGRGLAWEVLCWRPEVVWLEPWRWWSAGWVHLSVMHLQANLVGVVLVIALGWVARVETRAVLAWALAWPLTHLLLLVQPELGSYGGLSGVLHAGVIIAAVSAWRSAPNPSARWVAGALGVGVLGKVLAERPWASVLTHPAGWDIAVAPGAHASGLCAGAALATALVLVPRRRDPPRA